MDAFRTEVRIARGVGSQLVAKSFELTAPNVGEVLTIGARRRALVEVDRDLQLFADALAESSGERDAVVHRRAFEWDEGDDVRGTESRVFALVHGEVDEVARLSDAGVCGV